MRKLQHLVTVLLIVVGLVAASPDVRHQHDFDFELGRAWHVHLKRLLHPLTGSHSWVEYDGTSIVRSILNGRGDIGELSVSNAISKIEGMSLRLYHPDSGQWSVYWANAGDGELTIPLVGNFNHGVGRFYSQDTLNGKAIFARFIFSNGRTTSFSADGGITWETNWIADFTRSGH